MSWIQFFSSLLGKQTGEFTNRTLWKIHIKSKERIYNEHSFLEWDPWWLWLGDEFPQGKFRGPVSALNVSWSPLPSFAWGIYGAFDRPCRPPAPRVNVSSSGRFSWLQNEVSTLYSYSTWPTPQNSTPLSALELHAPCLPSPSARELWETPSLAQGLEPRWHLVRTWWMGEWMMSISLHFDTENDLETKNSVIYK